MVPHVINLRDKLAQFSDHWNPRIVGELNGQHVKLAKVQGAFEWHSHRDEDEFFMVLHGRLTIEFRDGAISLEAGECAVVPRGTEHRPLTDNEAHILLFEPASTVNTGANRSDRTRTDLERL